MSNAFNEFYIRRNILNEMAHSNTEQFGSCRFVSIFAAIAVSALVAFAVSGCGGSGGNNNNDDGSPEAFLDSQSRIGGSSTVITLSDVADIVPLSNPDDAWGFYNVANDLRATQVGIPESAKYSLTVEGSIQDIDLVEYPAGSGAHYALLSMGDQGIAVVNVTDPTNMLAVLRVHVNYEQSDIAWTDGGGNVTSGN